MHVATGLLASRKWVWGEETRFCYSPLLAIPLLLMPALCMVLGAGVIGVGEFLPEPGIKSLHALSFNPAQNRCGDQAPSWPPMILASW